MLQNVVNVANVVPPQLIVFFLSFRATRVTRVQAKDTKRQTSMKTEKIEGAHGEFLLVQWEAPNEPRLLRPPGDNSIEIDLNSFDEYQVYWATDSQTFFNFEQPNEEGWVSATGEVHWWHFFGVAVANKQNSDLFLLIFFY